MESLEDMKDRSANVTIGGKDYPLIMTTKATKEIAKRYGGLDVLGEKLMKAETFDEAIGEVVWLIALLANQAILIQNFQNRDNQKGQAQILTEDEIELMTTPADMVTFKEAITEAMVRGTKRHIESEDEENEKNPEGA